MLTPDQDSKLTQCVEASARDDSGFTGWEEEFILDLDDKRIGLTLTDKQATTLDKVYQERVLGAREPRTNPGTKKPIKALAGMAGCPFVIVYRSPGDYPGKYVARRFEAKPNGTVPGFTGPISVRDTYELVRDAVRANLPGATRILLNGAPDAVVMEMWV